MQIYHNHVVFQSFSDLYYIDMAEQRKQERRKQALAAIHAASAMASVQEQYNVLRKQRSMHADADAYYRQLVTRGVPVDMSARTHGQHSVDNIIPEEEVDDSASETASSSSSSYTEEAHTPSSSRGPSRSSSLYESRPSRRMSSSSVDTAATSLHSSSVEARANDATRKSKNIRFYLDEDNEEDLSYPAALHASSVARRLQRKEADLATLADEPDAAGRGGHAPDDLLLRRF